MVTCKKIQRWGMSNLMSLSGNRPTTTTNSPIKPHNPNKQATTYQATRNNQVYNNIMQGGNMILQCMLLHYAETLYSTRKTKTAICLVKLTTRLDSILDSSAHKSQHMDGAPATTSSGSHPFIPEAYPSHR